MVLLIRTVSSSQKLLKLSFACYCGGVTGMLPITYTNYLCTEDKK